MPVLDTSFLIALRNHEPDALSLLAELAQGRPLVPAVVVVEVLTGLPLEAHGEVVAHLEAQFIVAHTSREWMQLAGTARAGLRRQGRKIRTADFWIACWAWLHQTYVVTRNVKDFEAMGVKARDW